MKVVHPRRSAAAGILRLARAHPKDHSTAGKLPARGDPRAGDEALRRVLVPAPQPSSSRCGGPRTSSFLAVALLKRKPPKLAAVALANKRTARIAWKLMVSGERYRGTRATAVAHGNPCSDGGFVPIPQPRAVLAASRRGL